MKNTGPDRPAATPDVKLLLSRALVESTWLLERAIADGERDALPSIANDHRALLLAYLAIS